MPKLHVFDDDNGKLKLANDVVEKLKAHNPQWELGFCKDLRLHWPEAMSVLGEASNCVCVIDVELLREKCSRAAWGAGGFEAAINAFKSERLLEEGESVTNDLVNFRNLFGEGEDFSWAVHAFTYVKQRRVPSFAISTREHKSSGYGFNERLKENADFDSLPQWKSEIYDAEPENQNSRFEGMAKLIHQKWEKYNSSLTERIWLSNDPQPNSRKNWFSYEDSHPHIKHDHSSCSSDRYAPELRAFLDSVVNKDKRDPIDFSSYNITQSCHEAIKKLVGKVARVDQGTERERVPDLNTIVLLAAAWDPNAIRWFSEFKWNACYPLMHDSASKAGIRSAITAIGGESDFFRKMLIHKDAEPIDNKWATSQSFVENVCVDHDSLTIEFGDDCSKLMSNFTTAKEGQAAEGGCCTKLVEAWQSLATCGHRTVDIIMKERKLSFAPFARP